MSRSPRFEIVRTAAGWHARFRAGNGQVIFTTEVYKRRRAAQSAVVGLADAMWQASKPYFVRYPRQVRLFEESQGLDIEVREVDERYVPPPVVLEPPYFHKTTYPIVGLHTRNAHRGPAEDFWHDREYHWRNCDGTANQGGDCTEAIPPTGTEVHSRMGSARYTP